MDKTIRILVLGTAGSGKTTLLRKISYPWSSMDSSSALSSSSSSSTSVLQTNSTVSPSIGSSSSSLTNDILTDSSFNHTIGSNVEIVLHRYEKPTTTDNLLNNNNYYYYPTTTATTLSSSSASTSLVAIQLIEVSDDIEYQEAVKLYYGSIDGVILLLDASLSADIRESEYLLDEFSNYMYRKELDHHRNYPSNSNNNNNTKNKQYEQSSTGYENRNNSNAHRTTARRLQMIPFLVIANKVDKVNRINTLVHNIVSGNYFSNFFSSSSSLHHSPNQPLSPLAVPRPAGTVTNTKIITRLDTSIATSSSSSISFVSSLVSSVLTLCSCRPSTRYFPITLTPTMIWTNLNNHHAPFPRDIIDHFFNEIIYMRYDYEHVHPDDRSQK